jgi:hypothetical protein
LERTQRDVLINVITPMRMLLGQLREIGVACAIAEFEVLAIEVG